MKNSSNHFGHQQASETMACACFNLRKATRAVTQMYEERLREAGLKATQFTLLSAIHNLGPISIGELADRIVMDQSTLTRNLRLLQRDGLIQIQPGTDRRVREVELTDAGQATRKKALPLWRQAQKEITDKLGGERFARLLDDLSATVNAARD